MSKVKQYGDVKEQAHKSSDKSKTQFTQGGASQGKIEERVRPARLVNRFEHPMTLSYNGAAFQLPPRGKRVVADYEKLGNLPKGVTMVKLPKSKKSA